MKATQFETRLTITQFAGTGRDATEPIVLFEGKVISAKVLEQWFGRAIKELRKWKMLGYEEAKAKMKAEDNAKLNTMNDAKEEISNVG